LASYAVKETKIDNPAPFSWYGCISCISVTPMNTDIIQEKKKGTMEAPSNKKY